MKNTGMKSVETKQPTRRMTMTAKIQIVIVKMKEDYRVGSDDARVDLGERRSMVRDDKAVAAFWLRRGKQSDIEKAQAFATLEGYRVFTYPTSLRNALEQAKKDIAEV